MPKYEDYVDKQMVPWYKHQIEQYYEHKGSSKNFKPSVDPKEEVDSFRLAVDYQDFIVLQNSADEQVATLRAMEELNKGVNAYFDEWKQFLTSERDRLVEFRDTVKKARKHVELDKDLHDQYVELTPKTMKALDRYDPSKALR